MPELFAYVDETGDPGGSGKSSQAFGMAAVLLGPRGVIAARTLADDLRREFRIPLQHHLNWKSHVRDHARRRYVARKLSQLPETQVMYVYCRKSEVDYGTFTSSRARFYNYVAAKTYKNILWGARHWVGDGPNSVLTRFGHVKGFDHEKDTKAYFDLILTPDRRVPTEIERNLSWVDARNYRESMIADLFAGCLHQAITDDDYGVPEGEYLKETWQLVRNSHSCAIPLGLMSIPSNELVTRFGWFPCDECRHIARPGS